jgi:PST family polysaccharide transporter
MFGGHMTGVETLGYLGRNLDQVLIGRFLGAEALGFYSRAYALLMLPLQQISGPVSAVAVPALSRLKGDHDRYHRAFLSMVAMVAMVAMPAIAWMIATSDELVRFLLGEQWQECARIFAVLGLLAFAQILSNAALWVFVSRGEGRRLLKWSVINTVLVAVAVVAGLPWGAWGVAASYSLTGLFIRTPYLLYAAGKIPPIRTLDYYRVIRPFVWVAAVSYLVSAGSRFFLHGLAPWVVLLTTFMLAISFSLTLIWLIPYGRRTLSETIQIVRQAFPK